MNEITLCAGIMGFVAERFGAGVQVRSLPLRGGLDACGISRVVVQKDGVTKGSFVAKPFSGVAERELYVYRTLQTAHPDLSPTLLGWEYTGDKAGYLFLEWVPVRTRWPWRQITHSARVLDHLAQLHTSDVKVFEPVLTTWNYEQELITSAHSTMAAYHHAWSSGVRPGMRPMQRTLERVISSLPRLRSNLLSFTGTALLHGDAHPGNVVLRESSKGVRLQFLDWARARTGSPLEDVSSWVHSLAQWEPEAKRRHDTLLQRYVIARGSGSSVSGDVRDAFALAGASNALAGALRYHLAVLGDSSRTGREQYDSYRSASDWLRLIRRADACLRN